MRSRVFQFAMIAILASLAAGVFAADDVRIASEFEEAYTAPEPIETVKPIRVFYAPNREVEGYVTIEMVVNEKGLVDEVKVLYRTSALAVDNAVEAVSNWVFEPARLDGEAVKATVAYNVAFGLDLETYENESYAQKIILDCDTFALK